MERPYSRVLQFAVLCAALLSPGCRKKPAGLWPIRSFQGLPMEQFLAQGFKPVAIVEHPGGAGRTFVFEEVRIESTTRPTSGPVMGPPAGSFRSPDQGSTIHPDGSGGFITRPVPTPPPQVPRVSEAVRVRTFVLRVSTDGSGIIRSYHADEWPAR